MEPLTPVQAVSIPSNRRFTIQFDSGPDLVVTCTADEFLEANADAEPEGLRAVAALHVGEWFQFGGGAGTLVTITRVEDAEVARVISNPHPYRIYCAKGDHLYQYARQRCVLEHAPDCMNVCASVDYCHMHSPEAERHAAVRA